MVAFQSLGALSSHMSSTPGGIEIVDPGVPLTDYFAGDTPSLEVLRKHPSVRKVTGFIARSIASTPFNLYERVSDTDRRREFDHPLAVTLQQPSRGMTQFRFINDLMMDWLLYDRYCVVWAEVNGALTLRRIPAQRFRIYTNPLGDITEVRTSDAEGHAISIDPRQCILDAGYSPKGSNGLSPIKTLADILAEESESVAYRRGIWKNGARVNQVIERPKDAPWSAEARQKFQNQLANYRTNGGNDGSWLLLEDDMKLKEVTSFRPRDTLDLEGRKLTDQIVASAYFVPPELVGAREGTYSNIEAFRQMLYQEVAGPWFLALEQAFNVQLTSQVADGRPLYVEANVDAKLRGSFEEQARVLQTSTGGPWLTRNEARARANLPAIDGANELIVPMNVTEGGQASPTDSAPTEV